MTTGLDLRAYFARVGWDGGTSPTYETLAGLLRAHMAAIPFENLDVLLRRPPRLDLDSIQRKLVGACRGGYCFEHATLFAAVLEVLGFAPIRHAARVVLFAPRTEVPRAHMFLTVPLDGHRYVVDPGFGPYASPVPLALTEGAGTETHWMARDREWWVHRVRKDGASADAWVTTLEQEHPIDFEMANHFIATHPISAFVNWLMLSAVTPDGRINVLNKDVTILSNGESRAEQIADRPALRALLIRHFGFDLPEVEQLRVAGIPEWT